MEKAAKQIDAAAAPPEEQESQGGVMGRWSFYWVLIVLTAVLFWFTWAVSGSREVAVAVGVLAFLLYGSFAETLVRIR